MAIVFSGQEDPFGIKGIGNPLIQALQQRTQANRQQQQGIREGGILDSVISGLGQEPDAMAVVRAIAQAKGQGVSDESLKRLEPYFKQIGEQQQQKQLAGQKQQMQQQAQQQKLEQSQLPLKSALGTIQDMKGLVPKLGPSNFKFFSPEAQQWKTYKTSILGLLNSIPVRNQKEFEQAQTALTSPFATQEQMKAGLDAAERIINRRLGEGAAPEGAKTSERNQNETVNIRYKGKVKPIPRSDWEKLTEAQRQGYEQI